jgi:hypothetical protein
MNLQAVVDSYLETALWSSNHSDYPDGGNETPMDEIDAEWSEEALKQAKDDCESFLEQAKNHLGSLTEKAIGHNFWLTRNGHGAGFWDLGLGKQGETLSKISKDMGGSWVELGDDGKFYIS